MFGTELEEDLRSSVEGANNQQQANARQQRVIAKWLGGTVQYRDPAAAAAPSESSSQGTGPVSL